MNFLEELFQNKICTCNHSIKEEHFDGRCFALDFNGTIYSACRCSSIKVKSLSFRIERDEIPNTSTNKSNTTSKTKSIKPSIFQWRTKASNGR